MDTFVKRMREEVVLDIAGVCVKIRSDNGIELDSGAGYSNFIRSRRPKNIDIDLTLEVKNSYAKCSPEIIFQTEKDIPEESIDRNQEEKDAYFGRGVDWRISRAGSKILLESACGNFQVFLDEDLKKGFAYIIKSSGRANVSEIIYGFLQILLMYYLAKYRLGVIVHSAAVKDGGKGYLFAGPSGAGKSTTGRIWYGHSGCGILNDDRVILRRAGGRFYLYSTPWHGDFFDYFSSYTARVNLSSIFFIYHRKKNSAFKLGSRKGFGLLFQSVFAPFWDRECLSYIAEFISHVALSVPLYKFGFKNNKNIIAYVRDLA